MTAQNYCMVNEQTNVCDNVVMWDGNPNTWTPPVGYLMLVQDTTPAKNWQWDPVAKIWKLVVYGLGNIGFTWDGIYLITDTPEPPPIVDPVVTGAQTL